MESYKIIIICIILILLILGCLMPIAARILEMGMSGRVETIEQLSEENIKKINESKNRLIELTSSSTDEYARAIKALREPITFIEPTPDEEKIMERILNKPLLSVNEIRESMNMPPLKPDPAWEEVNIPNNGQSYTSFKKMEPKGHLLALKCETCGGELNVIQNSLFDDKTFYVCKYCGNKYIFKGD